MRSNINCFIAYHFSQCVGVLTEECWIDLRKSLAKCKEDAKWTVYAFQVMVAMVTCKKI